MLANEMKNLSETSRNNNDVIKEYWEDVIEKIKESAKEGKNEISFYQKFYYDFHNEKYDVQELRDIMKKKLEDEGFKVVKGYQIGKGVRNSESMYIIW